MAVTRRAFVGSVAALPLATAARPPAPAVEAVPPDSSFDPRVEVHEGHLRRNVEAVSRRAGGRPILAVVKNNGYGAGVANVGRLLDPLPAVHGLAVIKLQEAIALREAGVKKPVLLMGPFDERNLAEAAARDVEVMVYTPIGDALDRVAAARQRPVTVQVCVDTGIGRVGVPHARAAALVRDLAGRRGVRIAGTMMTFTEDPEFDREQLRRFRALTGELEGAGVALGPKHAASSYALFQNADGFLDMVRPGMALYGVYPEPAFRASGVLDLTPALALRARVAYVKRLAVGESAGYNRAYVASQPVWVATLPVGHADGWPRVAVTGARVRVRDVLCPVIASVSASHTIVEIGPDRRDIEIGDDATLFDWTEGSRPEDVSVACGASVYDLTMHLNPLLPRQVI